MAYLAKETLRSSPHGAGVVDVDVVVFGRYRLLYERLIKHHSVHLNVIVVFNELAI